MGWDALNITGASQCPPPSRALGAMPGTAGPIPLPGVPICMRRGAQPHGDQQDACLSAASLRHAPVGRAPQVPRRYSGGALAVGVAASMVTFFWPRKRQVTAPPGAIPAGDAGRHPELRQRQTANRGRSPNAGYSLLDPPAASAQLGSDPHWLPAAKSKLPASVLIVKNRSCSRPLQKR